jgi:hypothetical protein
MFNPFSKDYFEKFFMVHRNLFEFSNFNFIIVNSPSKKNFLFRFNLSK